MKQRRGRRPSPPVDFPLYGLDVSWPGERWVELFGEAIGDPVHWVCLGHQSPDGESVIYVETHSRPRTDAFLARAGRPSLPHVAFYAANLLTNLTLPAQSLTPWPDGLMRAIADHADERSREYAQWPAVRWQVDGVAVTARLWWFAGGWVAVSGAMDDVYVAVVGVGSDPAGVSLAVLEDDDAYHFGLAQPMDTPVMEASHAARADGDPPPPRRHEWHADQLQLIRPPGHDCD